MTTQPLTCCACGGPLTEADAAPAPDGVTLRYHRELTACAAYALGRLAQGKPITAVIQAQLGATERVRS